MATLTLKNISKQYKNDDHATLRSIDLTVTDDDFLVLLGPSSCGKTTLLRMIAGLIAPTEGEIWIGDRNITDLPPQNRGIGMVFQNYEHQKESHLCSGNCPDEEGTTRKRSRAGFLHSQYPKSSDQKTSHALRR